MGGDFEKIVKKALKLNEVELIKACKKLEMELELSEINGRYLEYDEISLEVKAFNYVLKTKMISN